MDEPAIRRHRRLTLIKLAASDSKLSQPARAFADSANLPLIENRDGTTRRLRKVRVRVQAKPKAIGSGVSQRFVASTQGSNHHTVILAELNPDGSEKTWVDRPVTLAEVYRRRRDGEPIVCREARDGYAFKFSLAANEYVEMDDDDGVPRLYRMVSVSEKDNRFVEHNDGRTVQEIMKKDGDKKDERIRRSGASLFKRKAKKIHVTYLGEVRRAGG